MLINQGTLSQLKKGLCNKSASKFLEVLLDAFRQFFILLDETDQVKACNRITYNTFGNLSDCNTMVSKHILPLTTSKETVLASIDKNTITVQWHKSSITFPGSTDSNSILIGDNITEAKHLKKHNFQLNYIIRKVPGYVFWKDTNSILIGCNENFSKEESNQTRFA